jgi:serine/threonine-protein kinase
MGIVYRARDTKLGRDVALKVLPEEFSQDRERLIRSEREARMLASLNHPNIAAIYDMKEADGNRCLVLEYVEGETLAERLTRGRVPVTQAVEISQQIAEALTAAHRIGIVHRDIKPANIKVTPEGRVKVLDFGLAKSLMVQSVEFDASQAPTLVTHMHDPIAGTPAYMSPEQLRGELVDRRADIWAFGCVLFELLSGQRTFSGISIADSIASTLKSDPDWASLPDETPPNVRELVRRCLEKDLTRRLNDIANAHLGTHSVPDSPIRSLAVLPFTNVGGSPDMDYLGDGLTESIISSLSKLPGLRVMSRSTVFRYRGRSDEAQAVGRELKVGAVLTGRVHQRNETLVISAELVDVEKGWQLWGDQYRRKAADIFTIEEDIAREISEKLRLKLTPENKNLLAKRYTENVAAYHLYLKGRFYWGKRTADGLQRGIQYFREAIEGDPTYALAYAGLAEGYVPLGMYCHVAPKDAFPNARAAAERALEIDPQLSEARAVLASIKSYFEWDLDKGEKEARLAVELDPRYPRARQVLAECLTTKRLFEEAITEVKRALDLDPLSLHMNAAVTMAYYFSRQYEAAIDYGRRTVEMDPNFFPGYFYLGLTYVEQGQYMDAVNALEKATVLSSNSTLMLAALGAALASWGKEDDAHKILQELEELGRRKYVSQVFLAAIHIGLCDNAKALTCLERAYDDRCSWLLRALATGPQFDRLREEARFQTLVRRVGLVPSLPS